ncbi:MAG: hypothetical protein Q9167_007203 [Letrouitia subvulpina]
MGSADDITEEKPRQLPSTASEEHQSHEEDLEIGDKNITNEASSPQSTDPPQRWNQSRMHIFRTLVACFGLFIMGMNDAAYGPLIPYLESFYGISYTTVSLVFLSPIVGYGASALSNPRIHLRFGQLGIAVLAPSSRLVAYIIISQHPPYPLLVIAYICAGYGNGLEDAAWNAWIGAMSSANEILGCLHGFYGLGGVLSPIAATSMIAKAGLQWYTFYYLMIGLAFLEVILAIAAFWTENAKKYREQNARMDTDDQGGRTREALRNRIVWICAVFLLIYVGIEVALGGWTVTYMIRIRHAPPFPAGMTSTGFWLGITVGRVVLGFITPWIGEKFAILLYLSLSAGFHMIFWLVPNFPVSALGVSLEGFFLGPMFPAAVVAATKLLPKHLHVGGIGFAAALGAAGACVLPFAVGAIAQAKGVQVLMPIVLAMLVMDAAVWASLPGLKKEKS